MRFEDEMYKRLNEARRKEMPEVRNGTFCKHFIEKLIEVLEEEKKGEKDE